MKNQKTKLVMIKQPAPKNEMVLAFTPGMTEPGLIHKSKVGSKIPKPPKEG